MKTLTAIPAAIALFLAAAIALAAGDAHATGIKTPPVLQTPTAGDIDVSNSAAAQAEASSASRAAAAASGSGTGHATADSSNNNTLATSQSLIDGSKVYSLSFAPPAWATLPVATNCMASSNKARSIGFGAASWADAGQAMDVICTAIELAQRARLACHFESAWLLETRVAEHLGTTLGTPPTGLRNWSPDECEALRRPALRMTQAIAPQPLTDNRTAINVGIACPQPAATPAPTRPVTRKAAPKPSAPACTTCCK